MSLYGVCHTWGAVFVHRFTRISRTRETMDTDGISSLEYSVVGWEKTRLYTKIVVDVGKAPHL